MLYRTFLASGILFCFLSCSKDDLTKPAPVSLQMEIAKEDVPLQEEGKKTYIRIEEVQYHFTALDFEGYRQIGDDYFFTKEFTEGLEITVFEDQTAELLEFDMPQGEYDQVKISLLVKKKNEMSSDAEGKKKKPAGTFKEDAAIIMKGYYTNTHEQEVPLVFVYDFDEVFEYTAQEETKTNPVLVHQDQQNKAIIQFDAVYWMQLINGRMLQSAKLTEVDGTPTIIISADHNEHIFNLLVSRIKDASELSFQ